VRTAALDTDRLHATVIALRALGYRVARPYVGEDGLIWMIVDDVPITSAVAFALAEQPRAPLPAADVADADTGA
jgi:hypothetical protein